MHLHATVCMSIAIRYNAQVLLLSLSHLCISYTYDVCQFRAAFTRRNYVKPWVDEKVPTQLNVEILILCLRLSAVSHQNKRQGWRMPTTDKADLLTISLGPSASLFIFAIYSQTPLAVLLGISCRRANDVTVTKASIKSSQYQNRKQHVSVTVKLSKLSPQTQILWNRPSYEI